MDHDLYKPLFRIRLEDLDPARHDLIVTCTHCGLSRYIDFVRYIAEKGDQLAAWCATMDRCPNCREKPGDYTIEMKAGVPRRTLKEVDPHR